MATRFDLLRTSRIGGLLGETPEERRAREFEEQMLAEMEAANLPADPVIEEDPLQVTDDEPDAVVTATKTADPLAPLPETERKTVDDELQITDDEDDLGVEDEQSLESAMSAAGGRGKAPLSIGAIARNNSARNAADAETMAKVPKTAVEMSKERAAYNLQFEQIINSPDMWEASPSQMLAAAKELAQGYGDDIGTPNLGDLKAIADYRSKGGRLPSGVAANKADKTDKDPDAAPTFTQSLAKGGATTTQLVNASVEAVAEVLGVDGVAKAAGKNRQYYQAIGQVLPEGVKLNEIEDVGDALQFTSQIFGEQLPLMGGPMAAGIAGKLIAGSVGAKVGAFGASWSLGVGEVQSGNKQISEDQKAGLATLAGGTVIAALDSVLPAKLGSMLVDNLGQEAAESVARRILLMPASAATTAALGRIATEGGKGLVTEGLTEGLQTFVGEVATAVETGTKIQPGVMYRMFEAAVTGSVVGSAVSSGTAAIGEAATGRAAGAPIRELRDADLSGGVTATALDAFSPTQNEGGVVGTPDSALRRLAASKVVVPARPVTVAPDERPAVPVRVTRTPAPVSAAGETETFAVPKGPVTSPFGMRKSFAAGKGKSSSNHKGIDIDLKSGTPVGAGASGVVVRAGSAGGYGLQVVIQHSDGTFSSYSHASKLKVKKGDQVAQGDIIMNVGSTGNSTGPHLHLERRDAKGRAINPATGARIESSGGVTMLRPNDNEIVSDPVEYENDGELDIDAMEDTYTEATGQQFEEEEDTEIEEDTEEAVGEDAAAPTASPFAARDENIPQPLRESPVAAPEATAAKATASLDEASSRNPARAALAEIQSRPQEDLTQPLPGEEPVFAQDEAGNYTDEVIGFVGEEGLLRPLGQPSTATNSASVEVAPATTTEAAPSSTPEIIDTEAPVLEEPDAVAMAPEAEFVSMPPSPAGLATTPPIEDSSEATAEFLPSSSSTTAGMGTIIPAGAPPRTPAVVRSLMDLRDNGQKGKAVVDPASPMATWMASEGLTRADAKGILRLTAKGQRYAERVVKVSKRAEQIEDRLETLYNDDASKSAVRVYMQKLVKEGVLAPTEIESLAYMFKDKDMGIEDIIDEVKSSVRIWEDEQIDPANQQAQDTKARVTKPAPKKLEDIIPGFAKVAKWLQPAERAEVKRAAAAKMAELFDTLPTTTEIAAVAISAEGARGWYENAATTIVQVFGQSDGIRFAALLAATSPQNSVRLNLYNALKIWNGWNFAGRPTDRKAIARIMGENVAGDKGMGSVLNAWVNNTFRALTEPTDGLVLSGPKVNSFFANLVTDVDEVTLDTWMAVYAGYKVSNLQGKQEKDGKGGKRGVKSPGYMAYMAKVRKAAAVATKRTGRAWSPAEIQETVWSWAKTVYEMRDTAGENRTIKQMLEAGAVTKDSVANAENFTALFAERLFNNILEEGGYGRQAKLLRGSGPVNSKSGRVGSVTDSEGTGFTDADFQRQLGRAADRLERRYRERRGDAGRGERGRLRPASGNGRGGIDERREPQGDGGQPTEARGVRFQRTVSRSEQPVALDSGQDTLFDSPLDGAPGPIEVPGYGKVQFGGLSVAKEAARKYMESAGLSYGPPGRHVKLDKRRAKFIADAYEEMADNAADPETAEAYREMIEETIAQWRAIEATGLKVEFIDFAKTGDPYAATPRLVQIDVAENNHMWVFKTDDGFGSEEDATAADHPMMAMTDIVIDGHTLRANDVFRIVHDYFGHIKDGHGFRAEGEENAWQSHATMYSPNARRAMTAETRGQNSWVNYGPNGVKNRVATSADTVYAPQKVGLLPRGLGEEGMIGNRPERKPNAEATRTDAGGRGVDDQAGTDGNGRELVRPPVEADGTIRLQHFSREASLAETDPTKWGTNAYTMGRSERNAIAQSPPRTYFGIATNQKGGYNLEFPTRPAFEARIPAERLYDVGSDPDSLWVGGKPWLGEQAIKDAGYAGYWHKNPSLGLVAVVFEPVAVVPVVANPDGTYGSTPKAPKRQVRSAQQIRAEKAAFRDTVHAQAIAILRSMGLEGQIGLDVVNAFAEDNVAGLYDPYDMRIKIAAFISDDVRGTTRHEVIHWARDNLFTKKEWATLATWAKNNPRLMAWAKANYPEENTDAQIEEAVAEGFARWANGELNDVMKPTDPVSIILDKLRTLILAVRDAFRGAGITSGQIAEAQRILNDLQTGKLAQRGRAPAPAATVTFGRKPFTNGLSRQLMSGKITPEVHAYLKANPQPKFQAAWHGTPAENIEAFKLDFIGTGEGAQVFGWGLYFAQKKEIAEWYRKKLTMGLEVPVDQAILIDGRTLREAFPTKQLAAYEVADRIMDFLSASAPYNGWLDGLHAKFDNEMDGWARDVREGIANQDVDAIDGAAELIKLEQSRAEVGGVFATLGRAEMQGQKVSMATTSKGKLYKVEVPEDADLLDLDAPLGDQTPQVKAALAKIKSAMPEDVLEDMEDRLGDFDEWTGLELVRKVLPRMALDDAFPVDVSPALETALENGHHRTATSIYLRDLGIPGSRYLDRDSRTSTDAAGRTRNFVIFDDSAIELKAKYRVVPGPSFNSPLSDPTIPNPSIFRRMHDQTMAFLNRIGTMSGKDAGWDATDNAIDAFRRKLTQRYQQVIKTQRRAAEQLGVARLPAGQNVMEMITADERGYKLQYLIDNMIQPMSEVIAQRGLSMADLGLYLYARHAPARNARIAAINPAFTSKPGSGMSDTDAANIIAQFTAEGRLTDLQDAAQHIDAMIAYAQQERLAGGLLTPADIAGGFSPGEFYVPLRGNENLEPEIEMGFAMTGRKGGGFSVAGGEGHRMFGRESMANLEEIVGYSITQAQDAIDRAYRNQVGQTMMAMFQSVGDTNFVKIDRVKRVAVWNAKKGQVEYQMQTRITDPDEQKRTLFVKKDGNVHKLTFNVDNPSAMRFVKAAKSLGTQEIGRVLQIMSIYTRFMSKSNTQWNLDFILANATKDMQAGVLNASTLNIKGLRRAMIKNLASLKPLMGALMGATGKAGAGFSSSNPWFQTMAEMDANGGKLNYGQTDPLDDAIKNVRREIKNAKRSPFNPLKAGGQLLQWIDNINSGFENMTRLAAYKALRDGGIPAKQAAEAVRELTTNFQQHGEWGPKFNAAFAFANASIIGGSRFAYTVATNPKILAGLIMVGALEDFLNSLYDEDEWDRYSEEDKHGNFILLMPDSFMWDIKIPAGYGLNAFITTGRKMSEYWREKKNSDGTTASVMDLAADAGMGFVNAFAPISGATPFNIISPTMLDPIVNIYQNKNNWGRPIMPTQPFRAEQQKPDSQLAYDNTHAFWKAVATTMNNVGGGNDIIPGWTPLDISPESYKHVTGETLGGAARTFTRFYTASSAAIKGEPVGPNDIPIVRRFVATPYGVGNNKAEQVSEFYERIGEVRTVYTQAKKMMERYGKDSPVYQEYRAANVKLIEFAETGKEADKRLNKYNAADNAAERGASNLTGPSKRDRAAIAKGSGVVTRAGKQISAEQLAKIKAATKEKKEALATEFNARYVQKVMGAGVIPPRTVSAKP